MMKKGDKDLCTNQYDSDSMRGLRGRKYESSLSILPPGCIGVRRDGSICWNREFTGVSLRCYNCHFAYVEGLVTSLLRKNNSGASVSGYRKLRLFSTRG